MTENDFRNINDSIMNKFLKDIETETDTDAIARAIEDISYFSCNPDEEKFPCVKPDAVLDETQSVKWNREQAQRLRNLYFDKYNEYSQLKNLLINECEKRLIELLGNSYGFSFEESKRIWGYAFDEFHSGGIFEVKSGYYDIAYLYNDLLTIRNNKGTSEVRDTDTLIAAKKLKEYEDLEEALENAYGECPNLLKTVVETLVSRANKINAVMGQKPTKVKLLIDKEQTLKIPCRVGDTIWYVDTYNGKRFMTEITICEIQVLNNMYVRCIGKGYSSQFAFDSSDFDKIVFTVRKEAEEKYEELGGCIKDD